MVSISGLGRRIRALVSLPAEVAALREVVDRLDQLVQGVNHTLTELNHTVAELNHDVRSGAEDSLPLFLGFAERLRLDADTAIAATQVVERQLAELEQMISGLRRDD